MPYGMWGALAGLSGAAASGLTGIVVKAIGMRLSAPSANAARCTVAALLFLPIMLSIEGMPGFHGLAAVWLLASVLFAIVIGDTALFSAISLIGASRAVPLAQSYPVFTVVMASVVLGEPLTPHKAIGALVTVAGTILISMRAKPAGPDGAAVDLHHWRGIALAVLAAASWSIGLIALRQSMHSFGIWQTATMRMIVAAIVLWPLAWRTGALPTLSAGSSRGVLLFSAAIGSLLFVSTICLVVCVSLVGAGSGAIFSSMAPLVTVPLGCLIFKETMTRRIASGIALVITGAILCVTG